MRERTKFKQIFFDDSKRCDKKDDESQILNSKGSAKKHDGAKKKKCSQTYLR